MHRLHPCSGTLVGWPRSFGIERYQEAATSYAAWLAQDPGVLSVYQIGDIGVPGLSDIDLVVVLDPNRVQGKECRFRSDFLPKDLQYLFMHDAVFLSESLFGHLYELLPVFQVQHRAGQNLIPKNGLTAPSSLIWHILLNDLAVISLSGEYNALQHATTLHVRNTIARINSLKFPLRMIATLGQSIPQGEDFEDAVDVFRKQFFTLKEGEVRERLFALLNWADRMATRLLSELHSLNQKVGTCTGEGVITLWNSFAPKGCSALAANHGGLSPFQFSQLQMYAKGRGPLSHYLRSCLTGNVFIEWLDQSYEHMVQQRAMLLNEYHHFLNSCGIQLGRVFGFGYQERGLPLRIQRIIARLRYKVFGPFEIPGWREAS